MGDTFKAELQSSVLIVSKQCPACDVQSLNFVETVELNLVQTGLFAQFTITFTFPFLLPVGGQD